MGESLPPQNEPVNLTQIGGQKLPPGGPVPVSFGISSVFEVAPVTAGASGDNMLVAGVAGKVIKVYELMLVLSTGGTLVFKDGASTDLTGPLAMLANGSIVLDVDSNPWFTTSAGNDFVLNLVVNTLSPLLPFFDFSSCDVILMSVQNIDADPSNLVTVNFETSPDGESIDQDRLYTKDILPGQQFSLEVGPEQLRRWFGITAQSQGPSYPDAKVTWEVVVRLRLGR
jgi:hypothetical protein